jgi:hypothetical protein
MATVASAVERTFAIPELLEHILLCAVLHKHQGNQRLATIKTIFALQHTNRTVLETIEGSPKLRLLMGLGQLPPKPVPNPAVYNWIFSLTPVLTWRELVVRPFNVDTPILSYFTLGTQLINCKPMKMLD